MERDPRQVERGNANQKIKWRWYFAGIWGYLPWSVAGEKARDGLSDLDRSFHGRFNNWVKATYLEASGTHVVDLAMHILRGCAILYRVRSLEMQGWYSGRLAAVYPNRFSKPTPTFRIHCIMVSSIQYRYKLWMTK